MKKVIQILSIISVLALMNFSFQEFYSSVTKVDYVEGSKTLKFTTRLNTEHISKAININPNTAAFEAEVKKYVNNHVDILINGANKNLTFTGSQVNGESVWVYYETGDVSDISSLKIKNNILIDVFPKQVNMVNIAYKGVQKNMTLMRGKETGDTSF